MSKLDELFGPELAERLIDVVVQALGITYGALAGRHDEPLGDDGITFGVGAWRIGNNQIASALARDLPEAEITWPSGALRVSLAGCSIHFYRAGQESDSVATYRLDGTETKRSIRKKNADQMSLFDLADLDSTAAVCTDLVFLHCGSPSQSLTAIHVGAPTSLDGDDTTWVWQEQVWPEREAGGGRGDGPPGGGQPFAPYSEGPRPQLGLTPKTDVDDQTDHGA